MTWTFIQCNNAQKGSKCYVSHEYNNDMKCVKKLDYLYLPYTTFTLSRLRPRSSRLLNRNWSCSFWSNLPSEHDLIRLHAISDDCNTTDDDLVPVHIRSDTCGSPTWDDPVRSTTFQYVYIRPLISVAIRNDCGCRLCRVARCGKKAICFHISSKAVNITENE